jgi:subtilisin family serine protease
MLPAILWCVAFALAFPSSSAELPPNVSTNAARVLAKLAEADAVISQFANGKEFVRVAVKVAEPVERDQVIWNDHGSEHAMRRAVQRTVDRVLARTGGLDVRVRRRFENFSGFSAEASWNALQRFLRDDDVVAVEALGQSKPHLAQGLPLMNGIAYRSMHRGDGIAVAICDTGVDYRHSRLGNGTFPNSKVIGGYDIADQDADPLPALAFEDSAHGTACAGIAAGDVGTAGDYVGGVAPGAKIYALKITSNSDPSQTAWNDDQIAAWDWCVTHRNDDPNNPIKVISHSFGSGIYSTSCDEARPTMAAAASAAVSAGITLVVSAGNDGFCDALSHPACLSSAIAVGAVYDATFGTVSSPISLGSCLPYAVDVTAPDKVASYSNTSSLLGLFAPGGNASTTDLTGPGGYSADDFERSFGGTSAACPYAAGAAAVLQSAAQARLGRFLTPAEVRSKLTLTGDAITDPKSNTTKPRINLGRAIDSMVATQLFTVTATLVSESYSPTNRAVDPNELVTLNVTLRNVGSIDASNVVVILVGTNGVDLPSAPQPFGTLVQNGAQVSRAFSFTARGACGGSITNLFLIQAGTNVSSAGVSWPLGSYVTRLAENFDNVKPPGLPTNWSSVAIVGNPGWVTSSERFSTPSNSAFATNLNGVSDVVLTSPRVLIGASGAELTFTHSFDTEYGFSGGVLEISVNDGPFEDIVDAGGVFKTNGYSFLLDKELGGPLFGRRAWTGKSGQFLTSVVVLPPAAENQNARLRWRFASGSDVGGTGWNIDSISVVDRNCGLTNVPRLFGTRQGENSISFSYNSFAGRSYVIEYKDNLAGPSWTTLRTEAGDDSVRTVTNSIGSVQRFYRVRVR